MNTSSRTRGSRSARRSPASTSSSWAIASISTPTARSPSHAPTSAARPGIDRERATEPTALPQLDHRRILLPRQVMARLGDIGCDDENGCRERRVVERREPVVRVERVGQVRPETVAGEGLRRETRTARARGARQPDDAAGCSRSRPRSHSSSGEVVDPRVDEPRERRSARDRAAVPHPEFRVRERIEDLALDHPGVERPPATPRPTRGRGPVPQTSPRVSQLPSSCATPPGARCAPTPRTNSETRSSPTSPAVAVLVGRNPRHPGRDHERRVRHDAVELLARDRLEQTAEPHLDPVHAVQQSVQPREGERPPGDVGRDDMRRRRAARAAPGCRIPSRCRALVAPASAAAARRA